MSLKKTPNTSTKQNRLKHSKWQETDQLAIYKYDQGVKQDATAKVAKTGLEATTSGFEVRRRRHWSRCLLQFV